MPQLASFLLSVVRDIFSRYGIYVIVEFPDGQIMWGDEPISSPYTGAFHMADCGYVEGKYDIFTIRAILSKLGKAGDTAAIESELYERINEGL
jgi:hypothetical protein